MSSTTVHLRDPQSGIGAAPGTSAPPPPGPLRILVVEDDESVRVSLKMLLQFDGHRVDTVMTAEEAVALFHQHRFDLVLADYALPGMNGTSLAAVVGTDANACPVIIVTAYAQKLPRKLPYVDCIIDKPFSQQELRSAISRVMKARTPSSPSSSSDHRRPVA